MKFDEAMIMSDDIRTSMDQGKEDDAKILQTRAEQAENDKNDDGEKVDSIKEMIERKARRKVVVSGENPGGARIVEDKICRDVKDMYLRMLIEGEMREANKVAKNAISREYALRAVEQGTTFKPTKLLSDLDKQSAEEALKLMGEKLKKAKEIGVDLAWEKEYEETAKEFEKKMKKEKLEFMKQEISEQ